MAKTLDELYVGLCVELRELAQSCEAGTWVCTNCGRPEADHRPLGDNRCTLYATTTHFRAKESERVKVVRDALNLLDQLKGLPV